MTMAGSLWRVCAAAVSASALCLTAGVSEAAGQTNTVRVCVSTSGVVRAADACRPNEQPQILVTESGLSALRSSLEAADTALASRLAAIEAALSAVEGRLTALENASAATIGRLNSVESTAVGLDGRVSGVEARIGELERTVITVTFTKVFDGGHYSSYTVSGTGFRPGSTVTTGVGTTATVDAGGMFSVFGGNLFCADQVSLSGTDLNGNPVTRNAPVECNSENFPPVVVTFNKVFDGGHYASYNITGSGFLAGSTVTTGVGTTATVAGDGTFTVFGGNLFCSADVTLSGTAANSTPVSRSTPVQCNNEP